MNILELMRFIQNLDTKYFKEINISRSVLYELKKTPKKLYKSKFITCLLYTSPSPRDRG